MSNVVKVALAVTVDVEGHEMVIDGDYVPAGQGDAFALDCWRRAYSAWQTGFVARGDAMPLLLAAAAPPIDADGTAIG